MIEEFDDAAVDARDTQMLDKFAAQIAEHFDTVQIIVTRHDGETGQTRRNAGSAGNWYARYGSVKEWLTHKDEQMREEVRGDG